MKPFSGNEAPPAPKHFKIVMKKPTTTGFLFKKQSFEYVTIAVKVGVGAKTIDVQSGEFTVDHIDVIA